MAYRGRGRGRGRGQLSFRGAKQLPFELFPEVPNLGNASGVTARITLAARHLKLQKYWNSSPYYLGEESDVLKKTKGMDIERFSDRNLERVKSKQPLAHFIRMDPAYVPAELAKGGREVRRAAKRVRWNPETCKNWIFWKSLIKNLRAVMKRKKMVTTRMKNKRRRLKRKKKNLVMTGITIKIFMITMTTKTTST
ncbi:uncharacterized protein LOC107839851 isoform X2 [Capsicum annuum]|uniref:uncharacterized protein LOC107839851 isoform X2 n=1 Tax=Capsicum annuum TaxID=4072 RepID=UPI0007BF6BA4|nr:uncharacterized protein LOC107839851 isoform X2 [Capsicum annuum]